MTWQSKLLSWYRKHRRDLPWRRTQDPYAIWISEIMLQQTTVEAVIPYYERFLKRFPTVQILAESTEEDVLRLWSGLGYYSRARNLHKAAREIMVGTGHVPDTVEELMKLSGIGRYTAGAIASIAFERRAPIVDGNVVRVLSRLFAIPEDPKSSEGKNLFWKKAEEILPKQSLGDFNQALMELGAMLCSPENPACLVCPVGDTCVAKKNGKIAEFPKSPKKTEYRDVVMSAAIIIEGEKLLMVQRPAKGLLKGMWEFPMVEGNAESLQGAWPVRVVQPLSPIRHSVLNRRLAITPFLCRLEKGIETPTRWIHPHDFSDLPTSSMNRKILGRVSGAGGR